MNIVYTGLELFGLCAISTAMLLLLRGEGAREQKLMQYFLVGSLIQNAGYLLELTAPTMEAALVAVKIQYFGSLTVPISYCYFIFSYCFMKAPKKVLNVLKVVDIVIIGLVLTCDYHSFYYRQIEWVRDPAGHGYLQLTYGPCYWLFLVFASAIPYTLSLYALVHVCLQRPEYAKDRKYLLILVLSALPVVALLSYAFKLIAAYDPTPLVLGLVLASVVILIWSRKVYDFSSLATPILLNSMTDGVIALDENRRVAIYNPAAAAIFKELKGSSIGKSIYALRDFPMDLLEVGTGENLCLNNRCYQGHTQPILDAAGRNRGYVVLLLDVTETTRYIEEIKRVRRQAEDANIAKSAFLANMSHEIRTPMNAIVGLSDIIMEESRGKKVYEYACDVKAASRNLLALINDILDLSKVEAGKMDLVTTDYHLKTLVNEVLNMMDIVASQHGLIVESEFDMSLPCRYLGDEGRIKQILINLISNAIKFTKHGFVRVFVEGEPAGEEGIERLFFRIEDSGCGIREEDLAGIFDNFRQVDSRRNRSVEGTGLGLSITRRLASLMGGSIRVSSVYGEGSTFTVDILQKITDERPLSEVPETAVPAEETLSPFAAADTKVLVVDDNLVNLKVARSFLQSYDLQITEASSGPEAIELVKANRYDIIFMDHMMPKMDGIETASIIRSQCGDNGRLAIIIGLTANAMEGVRQTFLENGFQDFITKPLDRRLLHETLVRWIPANRRVACDSWVNRAKEGSNRHAVFQDILIDGIDPDEVAEHCPGTLDDYRELLDLYCLDGERKAKLLRELLQNGDYSTYGIEVHGLKSASANVGAIKLSDSARRLEQAVNRNDTTYVDCNADRLLADYEALIINIRQYLDACKSEDGNDTDTGTLTSDEMLAMLKEAFERIENFRSRECAARVEALLSHRLPKEIREKLTEIQKLLKLYEDDAAQQQLGELIDQITEEENET